VTPTRPNSGPAGEKLAGEILPKLGFTDVRYLGPCHPYFDYQSREALITVKCRSDGGEWLKMSNEPLARASANPCPGAKDVG
jgi:hypothetical protein